MRVEPIHGDEWADREHEGDDLVHIERPEREKRKEGEAGEAARARRRSTRISDWIEAFGTPIGRRAVLTSGHIGEQ